MRHTNREIQEAKMLARRLAASKNVSAPPLSRLRLATTLFFRAYTMSLRMRLLGAYRKMFGLTVCPRCHGQGTSFNHEIHDEFVLKQCPLCKGRKHIGAYQRETVKFGRALLEYRLSCRMSLEAMYSATGVLPSHISQHEAGLVPLDEWPKSLFNLADLQLDREAAGHVSTT